jgi:hypothetical protein
MFFSMTSSGAFLTMTRSISRGSALSWCSLENSRASLYGSSSCLRAWTKAVRKPLSRHQKREYEMMKGLSADPRGNLLYAGQGRGKSG